MKINSSYYEEKFDISKWDLGVLYDLYLTWCNDNIQNAECDKEQFQNDPNPYFDHVVFHAEITNNVKIIEMLKLNTI